MDNGRCFCGLWPVERTAWTEKNAGRRFVGCAQARNGCNYFRWVDDDYPQRSRNVISAMRKRIKTDEEQHLVELQRMDKMKEEMEKLKKEAKKWKCCFMILLFCFVVYICTASEPGSVDSI